MDKFKNKELISICKRNESDTDGKKEDLLKRLKENKVFLEEDFKSNDKISTPIEKYFEEISDEKSKDIISLDSGFEGWFQTKVAVHLCKSGTGVEREFSEVKSRTLNEDMT